jgi:hypothetical protein
MASHADWNEAFWRQLSGPESCGPVYLALDEEAIEELWQTTPALSGRGTASAAGAVEDLCRAVREDIQARGWLPKRATDCLARCCLFVLAYSRVAHREGSGAPAYWKHVCHLLDAPGAHAKSLLGPFGLDQPTFQELWARIRDELPIELPRNSASDERRWRGQLCNIEIVRSQAGLRQLDLSRVRAMLDERRWKRGLLKSANEGEIVAWITAKRHYLTPYAQRVLERNPEVARRQILREWQRHSLASTMPAPAIDQTSRTTQQGQSPLRGVQPLYLQLDLRSGRLFGYRGDDDAPVGAEQLASELRKSSLRVWSFDDLYERFRVGWSAAPGKRIILFVEEQRLAADLPALTELSGSLRCYRSAELRGLPLGWALVDCHEIRRPQSINAFSWILPSLELRGGLIIEPGRWLLGAGPVAVIEGNFELEVDGKTWPVADGCVNLSTLGPGSHEVRCGGRVERLEIVPGGRISNANNVPRWVWPDDSGWPELTAHVAAGLRSLDGPFFGEIATQLGMLPRDKGQLDFGYACRRRPTVEDLGRAYLESQGEILPFAAIVRGRA